MQKWSDFWDAQLPEFKKELRKFARFQYMVQAGSQQYTRLFFFFFNLNFYISFIGKFG
jgi:hypothetical protein